MAEGGIGRSVFAKLVVRQARGDAHAEKDVLSENPADAVSKMTQRYDNHHFKPMSPGIMLGPKPLAKHDEQFFQQPQLLQHWHKAVFYLFEACLHYFDDSQFLKDAFNKLEKAFIKKKKRHRKKYGGNAHISSEAGCDADGDDEDYEEQSCSMDGFNNVTGLIKNPASEDSESCESWGTE
jgi:hypothetical protein